MRRTLLLALTLGSSIMVGGCLHAPMPWSPDGKWIAYTVEVRPIEGMLKPGWLYDSPTSSTPPPAPVPSPPTGYRIWATRADSGESVLLEDSPHPLTAPGWSPDGRALAFGRVVTDPEGSSRFEVVILDGPEHRRILSSRPLGMLGADAARLPGQAIAWSPDGRYLAVPQLSPLGLAVIRADNGRQINSINDGFLPSWSPDGSRLAFFARGTGDTLNCIDSPTGQPRLLAEVGQAGQAPAWTRDSLTMVLAARRASRGGEQPGDQVEMLKVRVDTGQTEVIRPQMIDTVIGRNRAIEGVSFAFDLDGNNLFCATVAEGKPYQISWFHPREGVPYKNFSILDYTTPMGSLSLSPDEKTLAARIGSMERLSAPALCDLESPDLRTRLIAPDDNCRVEWIATLVGTARGILSTLPTASGEPEPVMNRAFEWIPHLPVLGSAQESMGTLPVFSGDSTPSTRGPLDRISLLPVAGEFESNSEQTHRLRRIGRLGRPLCDRPASAPPASPQVIELLEEARFFFDYLSESYAAAEMSLQTLEAHAETPDRRVRLLALRAQIFIARGDVQRADETIRYLSRLPRNPARTIEWTGTGYAITGTVPIIGRDWPDYLARKSASVRSQLQDELVENHLNPDNPRLNFGIGPFDQRGNPIFPRDPFNIPIPNDRQGPFNRQGPFTPSRLPVPGEGLPRL